MSLYLPSHTLYSAECCKSYQWVECPVKTQESSPCRVNTDAPEPVHTPHCHLSLQLCNNLGRLIGTVGLSSSPSNSNPRTGIEYWWTYKGHTTDRCSFLPESQTEKNKSTEISPDRDVGGIVVFSPLFPFFFYPSIWAGLWIFLISPTLCCALSLPNCLDKSANHHTAGISLSPALLSSLSLTPLLPLSLSLLLRRFAVLPQSWLVFCNRLNPFLSSKGRYFLLFWLCHLLPDSGCDIPCGAVVIRKKASTTLLHRDFRCHCTKHTTCCSVG